MLEMLDVAPERVAFYGIENHEGTPVYVHAKTCVIDDTWATIGSDNFNRRSWTHDSELSAVVRRRAAGSRAATRRRLRLTLAAEHLDRTVDDDSLLDVMSDCVDPAGLFAAFAESAAAPRRLARGRSAGGAPAGPAPPDAAARARARRPRARRWCPTSPCTTPTGGRAPSSGRVVSDTRLVTPVRRPGGFTGDRRRIPQRRPTCGCTRSGMTIQNAT